MTAIAHFTDEQKAVITHAEGNAWVSAVAGSGKTSVLVERIARLLEKGVSHKRIVVIQFNKSAQLKFAQDLAERIPSGVFPDVRTFHSIGRAMCIRLAATSNLPRDRGTGKLPRLARQVLRAVWTRQNGSNSRLTQEDHSAFLEFVSLVKSQMGSAADCFRKAGIPAQRNAFISAFHELEKLRIQNRWRTFDDMCWEPVIAMRENPELWAQFQMFDHLLIDEAQDCNEVQYEMIKGIAGDRADVMLVGDIDQTIYEWRGADTDLLIERFPKEFNAVRYPMTRTFRFGHTVALMASHLIQNNEKRDDKIVISANSKNDTTVRLITQKQGSDTGILKDLIAHQKAGTLHKCLILTRYSLGSLPYEFEMMAAGVPYHFYGREPTIFVPEVASMVAALCLSINYWPMEPDEIHRFIHSLFCSPPTWLPASIIEELSEKTLAALWASPESAYQPAEKIARQLNEDSARSGDALAKRAAAIELICSGKMAGLPPANVIGTWDAVAGVSEHLSRSEASAPDMAKGEISNLLRQFVKLASGSTDTKDFLTEIFDKATSIQSKPPSFDHVHIRTIHGSKGLEADHVYYVGLGAGFFDAEVEEERRLAYVAMTRAKHELVLLRPEDELLDKMNHQLDFRPSSEKFGNVIKYVYEAEIGLSQTLNQAIKNPIDGTTIECRIKEIGERYLKEIGVTGIDLKVTTPAPVRVARKNLFAGSIVYIAGLGNCELIREVHGTVWEVRLPNGAISLQLL